MTAKYNMIDKPSFRFELGGGFVLLIALIWFFDELDAGNEHYGEKISLGLAEGGVGIVTDKNYDTYASADTKAAVQAAIDGVSNGTIKVDSALDEGGNEAAQALRDAVAPNAQ